MAKRRERRVAQSSDRRKSRVESSSRLDQFGDSVTDRKLITIFVLFFIVIPAVSIFLYCFKYAPHSSPAISHVHQRGLIKTDVNYQEILTDNSKVSENVSHRHYTYPVLAYITPWNSKGYEIAKKFNSKFTHLSPVWYDIKSQGTSLILEGRHNADKGWISELRMNGDALHFPGILLRKKKLRDKAIELILTECKELEYDGVVLESWSRWAAYGILHDPDMRNMALEFIKQLGHALHSVNSVRNSEQQLQLVYVIGPPHSEKLQAHDFGPEDLQSLSDAVDGFSLMTYDFSGPHNPGPNAPLKWIRSILQLLLGSPGNGVQSLARKIFLGINFYGKDFILAGGSGGGAITGTDYLHLLEKHRPVLQWEKNSGEHFFIYSDEKNGKHAVFYPSLMSVSLRLEEARLWGTGLSIWEIGQGLDYFFDILQKDCVLLSYAMEALNAASLTPISVLCERRTEPRKIQSLSTTSLSKLSTSRESLTRSVHGGLVLVSAVLGTGLAKALTYEEALQQSTSSSTSDGDVNGILDSVISFGTDNPAIIAGGVTILAVPLILSLVLKKPKPWGVESAKTAYAKIGEDGSAQLLDIRPPPEFRQVGSPDVRGLGKKPVSIVYKGEDKPGFLKKLSLKFKDPENTTLFILDKFDGNSELVAELVTVNGFKAAYAIKDGAEGPRGWMNSGLPWIQPKKALSLDLSSLTESIGGVIGEGSDGLPVTLGIAAAAATGLGLLAFTEIETVLQLLGSAAIVQLVGKKLLFAEDRKQTLQEVDEFLDTKIAPKELVDDIKEIGKALLPTPVTSKGLPAPAEANPPLLL
ncbi:hypothetical protein Patl1_00582 [Pistacia atlantica]|uniref:Uncharacterized protein n=1 Tax=Pistacia atlantica TaxID=434234 RepID=A0ACC1CAV4_9ROSI|nr:hypothetical protein Patl1_00582 [Pistacia atlantica]